MMKTKRQNGQQRAHSFMIVMFFMLSGMHFLSAQITDPVRFLALGDSYTIGQNVPVAQRWPNQLADSLAVRGYTIDSVRFIATTGWRTDQLRNAIAGIGLEDKGYNFVSLLIGVNNQYQNRPFSQYENEFPALLDSAIRYAGGNPDHVFVVSIPDYAYTPFGQSADPDEISAELAEYNAYNQQVAMDMGVQYFNITPISQLGVQFPEYVANDGLHPSGIQYTKWVELMLETFDMTTSVDPVGLKSTPAIDLRFDPDDKIISITLSGEDAQQSVRLMDLHGRVIYAEKVDSNMTTIHVDHIPTGLYVVDVSTKNARLVQKLFFQ